MSARSQNLKNTGLLNGLNVCGELYATVEDYEEIFNNLEKPKEVVTEPRATFLKPGVLSTVKGSAYMEYGNTKVLAKVSPPRELTKNIKRLPMGIVNCYVNFAAFATRDLQTVSQREKSMSSALKKALEPVVCRYEFGNFQLDIRALVLDDDGCVLSTAINCCGVALIEYGLSTYDIITASTVCIYRDIIFVNPNAVVEQLLSSNHEEIINSSTESGMVTTSTMPSFEQIAGSVQTGYLTQATYNKLLDYTLEINKQLAETVGYVLTKRAKEQRAIDELDRKEEVVEEERLAELIKLMEKQSTESSGDSRLNITLLNQ